MLNDGIVFDEQLTAVDFDEMETRLKADAETRGSFRLSGTLIWAEMPRRMSAAGATIAKSLDAIRLRE